MSPIEQHKLEICEIGRRIYHRQFAAANDGNITYRISDNEVLCTPTMHCKGFLTPDDICTIDMDGQQVAGIKKRSSEALLHLAIMRARPDVRGVVHCHPPHATAFAIAREPIPQGISPEVEMFLGNVALSPYGTPGTKEFAETVLPFVDRTNIVVLANHGTVSFGETVERAYWWTEILDAYCRTLLLAKQLGHVEYLPPEDCLALLQIKGDWGMGDPRLDPSFDQRKVRGNEIFRATWEPAGVKPRAFPPPDSDAAT